MQRWPLLVLLTLLVPAVGAQPDPADAAGFLAYHAPGGRDADPLASPLAPPPGRADRFPATFFDGATRADNAPENAPERALAHYREFQRLLLARQNVPAGATLTLDASLSPDTIAVRASSDRNVSLSLVLFEQGAPLDGRPQPYVARVVVPAESGTQMRRDITLEPGWVRDRLGVIAIARAGDDVLQSATWTALRNASIVQQERAVLVEHVTASWCDPCRPADEAFALLSTQRGLAAPLGTSEMDYFRAPGWPLYAGLALGAIAAAAVLRRRGP